MPTVPPTLLRFPCLLGVLVSQAITAPSATAAPPPQASAREWIMGTVAEVRVYAAPDAAAARAAAEAALAELRTIDRLMAIQRPDSDVSRVNRDGGAAGVTVDRRVVEVVQRSIEVSRLTDGAFDVTVLPVVRAWGFDGPNPQRPAVPPAPPAGYRTLVVDERSATIRFSVPNAGIDLGGIAKGYALDRARDLLRARGVRSAWLDLGGNVATLGVPPDGSRWRVGIRDPRRPDAVLGMVEVDEAGVSTSSDAERYVEDAEGRAGHIIDPRTGRPASALLTATVVAPSAALADALSTAAVVMGGAAFSALAERLGVAALLGSAHSSEGLQLTSTPGLRFATGD